MTNGLINVKSEPWVFFSKILGKLFLFLSLVFTRVKRCLIYSPYIIAELADKAHVMQDNGEPLTAVLGLVDIARGTNSYYKLQALEGDSKMR